MPILAVYKSTLESARDRCVLTGQDVALINVLIDAVPPGMQRVELNDFPTSFIRALLEDSKLKPNQRASLALHIYGIHNANIDHGYIYEVRVANPVEFGSAFAMFGKQHSNAEIKWNGRWYPVVLHTTFADDENRLARIVHLVTTLEMGTHSHDMSWLIEPSMFQGDDGGTIEHTILHILEQFGMRRLQISAADFNLRLVKAERMLASVGTQVWVKGSVLALKSLIWSDPGLNELPLGTVELPRRAIVEPSLTSLEGRNTLHRYGRRTGAVTSRLPMVRIFSLDTKTYVFADIDDLEIYEYDVNAISRLFLPDKMKDVLVKLFTTPTDRLFGDIVRGKHGGVVILACGNPGVGKTLTAEIYAEIAQRPLYVLEFGEMGTTVNEIEEHLQAIFARVVRWQAVLQFDECEIFLSQRGDDLERSAIVGIFLRMLDYYEGLLFLTTNRPDSLDYAIRSRVMLRLEYPDLDHASRINVWRTMFEAAGVRLVEDDFSALAQPSANGRQIRNLVRLARILHPEGEVTVQQMLDILGYGCR